MNVIKEYKKADGGDWCPGERAFKQRREQGKAPARDIMLNEISHAKKCNYCMLSFIYGS